MFTHDRSLRFGFASDSPPWAQPGTEATYQRLDGIVAVVGDEIVLASDIHDRVTQAKLEGRTVTDDNECGLLESVLFEKLLLTTHASTASRSPTPKSMKSIAD